MKLEVREQKLEIRREVRSLKTEVRNQNCKQAIPLTF